MTPADIAKGCRQIARDVTGPAGLWLGSAADTIDTLLARLTKAEGEKAEGEARARAVMRGALVLDEPVDNGRGDRVVCVAVPVGAWRALGLALSAAGDSGGGT